MQLSSCFIQFLHIYQAVATGPAGLVLAGPLSLKAKIKFHFTQNQIINGSGRIIFSLVRLVILQCSK